jgi:hypothetical protein
VAVVLHRRAEAAHRLERREDVGATREPAHDGRAVCQRAEGAARDARSTCRPGR